MIKFEFTISDIDATNIFDLFQRDINHCNEMIIEEMCHENSLEVIEAYRSQIAYIRQLKGKLTHTRISENIE